MPVKNSSPKTSSEHSELGLERIVFFSDAVMAIAITLLAIDLKVPELARSAAASELMPQIGAMWPRFTSFIISFAVVAVYWSAHHRYFNYIKRYNTTLIQLNLLFLLFIALMPFFASLLGQYGYVPVSIIAYAAAVTGTGFTICAVWYYASHNHRLVDENLDPRFIRTRNIIALVVPVVFLISIPFAFISPLASIAIWFITPVISIIVSRISRHKPAPKKGVK